MPHPDASVNRKRWLLLRFEASTFHPVWFVVEENEMVLTTFNLDDNMNFGKNPKAWANPTLIEKKKKWRVYHLHEIGIITSDIKYRKEKKFSPELMPSSQPQYLIRKSRVRYTKWMKRPNKGTNERLPTDRPTDRPKEGTNQRTSERKKERTNERTNERNNERTDERTKERTNDWPTDRPKEGTDEQTNERKNKRGTERASRCTDGRMKEQAKGHMTTRAPWMHLLTLRTRKGFLTAQRNVWWFYLQKR